MYFPSGKDSIKKGLTKQPEMFLDLPRRVSCPFAQARAHWQARASHSGYFSLLVA